MFFKTSIHVIYKSIYLFIIQLIRFGICTLNGPEFGKPIRWQCVSEILIYNEMLYLQLVHFSQVPQSLTIQQRLHIFFLSYQPTLNLKKNYGIVVLSRFLMRILRMQSLLVLVLTRHWRHSG